MLCAMCSSAPVQDRSDSGPGHPGAGALSLDTPGATEAMARRLAPHLQAGDVLLLDGPIGAGKTHFARALIGALQAAAGQQPEDVPSPSFTLVQTYGAGPLEIWHVDLYRLDGAAGLPELGLDEAFDSALCLIEWPDRLGPLRPADALELRLSVLHTPGARALDLHPSGPRSRRLAALLAS